MEPYKEKFDLKNHMDLLSYMFIEKENTQITTLHIWKSLKKKKNQNFRN